jgi:hypothetical protein
MTEDVMNIDFLRQQWGEKNASNGMKEEEIICRDFNNDKSIVKSLIEGFSKMKLGNLSKYPGRTKTDVYAEVIDTKKKPNERDTLNLQIKMYTPPKKNRHSGGQVGKIRWAKLCSLIPSLERINEYMSPFFEVPLVNKKCDKSQQIKLNAYDNNVRKFITKILNKNKREILELILLGSEENARPNLFCGVEYVDKRRNKMTVFSTKDLVEYLMDHDFSINDYGNRITLGDSFFIQRKGGDRGRSGANFVQFRMIFYKLEIPSSKKLVVKL